MMQAIDKKKLIKILIFIPILGVFLLLIYFIFFFSLFDIEKELLTSFTMVGSKNKIEIYFVPSTATTNENIQIIKIDEDNESTVVKIIEGYELVKKIRILNNNSFKLELGDKYSIEKMKTDSVLVINISK